MNVLIEWALQPLGMVCSGLLLTLLTWLMTGAKPRLPFTLFSLSMLSLLVFAMPSFANALVIRLENARVNPAHCQLDAKNAPIVVLGGGIDLYVPSENPYEVLHTDTLIRTLRAPEFATSETHFYLLGGGNSKRNLATSMQQVLAQRNVAQNRISIESESKSTIENARALKAFVPPNTTINIITSMLHVKRASATFEKAGYRVCHIGVDSLYSKPKPPVSLLPYLSGLRKTTLALHEILAWHVYKLKNYL